MSGGIDSIKVNDEMKKVQKSKKVAVRKTIRQYVFMIAICIIISLIVRNVVVALAHVDGESMMPTLKNKDVLIIDKISSLVEKYKTGQIIIFDSHMDNEIFVKRVIGVAGDEVEIKQGKVYINGKELKEDYLKSGTVTAPGKFLKEGISYKVPKDHIFVMGDNREHSLDSRTIGAIAIKDIKGKAFVRVGPMKNFRFF